MDMAEQISFEADFGIHKFEIQLLNKEITDTVLDKDGAIIDDLFVAIRNIDVDRISMINEINFFSEYQNNEGELVNTYGHLGFPTVFTFYVQVPGYMFKRNISVLDTDKILSFLKHSANY